MNTGIPDDVDLWRYEEELAWRKFRLVLLYATLIDISLLILIAILVRVTQ